LFFQGAEGIKIKSSSLTRFTLFFYPMIWQLANPCRRNVALWSLMHGIFGLNSKRTLYMGKGAASCDQERLKEDHRVQSGLSDGPGT
jgi:hypothetical protein